MEAQIPTSLQDWQLLNGKIEDDFKLSTSPRMEKIIWFVTISGPITGVLYLLSAWKRWKNNGSWLVRVDEEGYFYPHTFVLIPIAAFVFTCVNLWHSVCLLSDLSSYVRTRTVVSSLLTFPVITSFGWTRIWSLLYAMPPSRLRLTQVSQKIGSPSPMTSGYWATLFNASIIGGYLLCLFGTTPSTILVINKFHEINSSFARYQILYLKLIKSFTDLRIPTLSTQLQTLLILKNMSDLRDELHKHLRVIHTILLFICVMEAVTLLWPSYRILEALYYQVMILRQAGKRFNHIRMHFDSVRNDSTWSRANLLKIASAPKPEFTSRSTTASSENLNFHFRIRHYLPTFKRGTGVSAALWKSGPFRKTQKQMIDGGARQMVFYYRQLRRYAMNTLWQTVITVAVITSFLILLSLLVGSTYQFMSPAQLEVVVFVWINITWNCGTGFLLSIISCIVAFSSAPSVSCEPPRTHVDESE